MSRAPVLLALVAVLLSACSGKSEVTSVVVGPAGGTFSSADGKLTVEVPSGALGADVTFTVKPVADPLPGASGPVYELGPEGMTFSSPIAIAIDGAGGASMQVATEQGGRWVAQPTLVGENNALVATTTHLSRWGRVITFPDWCASGSASYQQCCSEFGGTWGNTESFRYTPADGGVGSCSCSFLKGTALHYDRWSACVAVIPPADAGSADAGKDAGVSDAGIVTDAGSMGDGGNTADAGNTSLVSGAFHFVQYKFENTTQQPNTPDAGLQRPRPLGFAALWGTITFDGAGGATVNPTGNRDGVVGPETAGALSYSVSSDRTLTVSGGTTFVGPLLADGSMTVMTASTGAPALLIGVKKGTGFSNASLAGTWTVGEYLYDTTAAAQALMPAFALPVPVPRGFSTFAGAITFDGAGGANVSGNKNVDGTVNSQTAPGLTYTTATDGALTVLGGSSKTGALHAGGNVALLSSSSGSPTLMVAVKRGTGFGNPSLNGPYGFAQYRFEPNASQPNTPMVGSPLPAPKGFSTLAGTLTFDGAGGATLVGSENRDGATSAMAPQTLTYSVTSDGTVTVSGSAAVSGTINATGNVVVLAGTTGPPTLIVGIKK